MIIEELLTKERTNAARGVAALAIFVLHIVFSLDISPFFNMWGGMFVGVFLILSGYGINESYLKKGFSSYWSNRLSKVVVPTFVFVCLYSLLSPSNNLQTCIKELTYQTPTYWFVFHIVKCYAVYWIARRFCGRFWLLFMTACAVICLNFRVCDIHLESEQAFSFLAGVLLSEYKSRVNKFPERKLQTALVGLFLVGLIFYLIKLIPSVHQHAGTVPYNYLLMPFRLTWALVATYVLLALPIAGSKVLQFCGKRSLEIYIAHVPMIGMIHDARSTVMFVLLSIVSLSLLLAFKRIQHRLSPVMGLYIAVNALFVAKYSARITSGYAWITLAVMVFHFVFVAYLLPFVSKGYARYRKCVIAVLGTVFVCMAALQCIIDPSGLQVDRWSAIHNFIGSLFRGIYPYSAQTHLGGYGSPFPVWQLLHVPFYLLGNVGLSFFALLAVWAWILRRCYGTKAALLCLSLIAVSPAVWYEAAVRSDLLSNFLLLSAATTVMLHAEDRFNIAFAVLTGLLMSTRLNALIPLGLLLLPSFLQASAKRKILFPLIALTVLVLTFLPLLLWDANQLLFFENNPFILQARQGHIVDFILFIPLGLLLSLCWKTSADYNRNVAYMLLALVAVTFIHNMMQWENYNIFSSAFDITYFTTLLPFACVHLILEGPNPLKVHMDRCCLWYEQMIK